jgi:hypothetical protein
MEARKMSNPLTFEDESELFGSDGFGGELAAEAKGAGATPADLQGEADAHCSLIAL